VDTSHLRGLEGSLQLAGLARELEVALATSPAAESVALGAADVLAACADADAEALRRLWQTRSEHAARILAALGSYAPFFIPLLSRNPQSFLRLASDDLSVARTAADYQSGSAAAIAGRPLAEHGDILRRYKYDELARITARDLLSDIVPLERVGEVLHELSFLADALLGRCLDSATAAVEAKVGPLRRTRADGSIHSPGFVILGLGKLGAAELNYSSDVDLIYLYEAEDDAGGLQPESDAMTPAVYFTRLAQELGLLVTRRTGEGILYRIDLDLRPEGAAGPLVISTTAFVDYYEHWAAVWEKAAAMKARPVAGDLALGWRVIRALAPILYRSTGDYRTIAAIHELKQKVETARAPGETFDVKVGHGGIRDVETIAQTLQLLHGGRILQIRGASTEQTLEALAETGVLPRFEVDDLQAAYRFLRRTENRLQMIAEQQTQRLPKDDLGLQRLAASLGFAEAGAFSATLDAHRRRVRQLLGRIFPELSERILDLLVRRSPRALVQSVGATMLETLAAQFAHAIEASSSPERAFRNLERFVEGVGARRSYYELLLDRPELVPRLTAMFASSEYLSWYLATNPDLIEPIFNDPNVLLLSPAQLDAEYAAILAELRRRRPNYDDLEVQLAALRLFHHRQLVNIGLLDIGGKIDFAAAESALTDLAEACLRHGLEMAREQVARRAEPPAVAKAGRFLVLGMGKLATRELTYGSDLDVIFFYGVDSSDEHAVIEAQEYFVRLAQKLIWALSARTVEGVCYEIDARLRPSGTQGMLVTSLASFERYHETSAQVWERQALLRARGVAGSEALAADFERLRRAILTRPLPVNAAAEIHRIRQRVEAELARETVSRHDFKTGRGGIQDIENVVQLLQLTHAAEHPDLLAPRPTATQIERLRALGYLDDDAVVTLRNGWHFLQRLSSRLRIVENRSISDLDEERGDLDAIARTLGYPASQRSDGARRALLEDYAAHTRAIRAVYDRLLGNVTG
jgi:glutamate-ammonia-ligase adenylyltransferase